MKKENLENTSYCGLYCVACPFGQGTIPDLARDLRKELRAARFSSIAETIPFAEFKKYEDCYEVLGAMVRLRCKGCRGGSRSKFCKIAGCVLKKEYAGCWECDDFGECKKLDFLNPVHGDAHRKNLRKIKKFGVDAWIEESPAWYSAPKKK